MDKHKIRCDKITAGKFCTYILLKNNMVYYWG